MKKTALAILFCVAMAFAGCQTPPDRLAFSAVQTSDSVVDTAYKAWVLSWKERRAKGETVELLSERDEVAKAVSRYKSAHRTALKAAELAVKSGVTTINFTELSALKGELLNALTHR